MEKKKKKFFSDEKFGRVKTARMLGIPLRHPPIRSEDLPEELKFLDHYDVEKNKKLAKKLWK